MTAGCRPAAPWRALVLGLWLASVGTAAHADVGDRTAAWVGRPAPVAALVPSASAPGCRFVLGFAALRDRVPETVGDCLEDEWRSPGRGDALQRTTNGLLVWRRADNVVAFTDGRTSWILGPLGLQQRPNDRRLAWEANPERLPIVPPPAPGERCHTAGLALDLAGTDAGAGNVVATFRFTNTSGVPCTFFGYVGAQLRDARGEPMPTATVRGGGHLGGQPGPSPVAVPPGGAAHFLVHWGQVPVGDQARCPVASALAVIPPDELVPLIVPLTIRACDGRLNVAAVRTATAAP